MLPIKKCPTCGRGNLRSVRRDVDCDFLGQTYVAPAIEFHECPDCGEKLYDRQAMQKMESYRPQITKRARKRSA